MNTKNRSELNELHAKHYDKKQPQSQCNLKLHIDSRDQQQVPLDALQCNQLDEHLKCEFTGIIRDEDRNQLNPFLYQITFTYLESEWRTLKSYNDLAIFFEIMAVLQTRQLIPRLTRNFNEEAGCINDISGLLVKPVIYLLEDEAIRRMSSFNTRLNEILSNEFLRNTKECRRFIEVSPYSFGSRLGSKLKECLVKRKTGGYRRGCSLLRAWFQWRSCWLVVKPSFIAYTDPRDNQLRGLMMFDLDFLIRKRNDQRRPHLTISNMSRSLSIRVKSAAKTRHLYDEISLAASQCEFTSAHRFESFAPIRSNSKVKWIVDGASYFKAVAEFIEMAQRQIFITDWFLSPELHLKRPHLDNRYRLDKLLKSKAEAGIEVYILLYKEVQSVLGINSAYSKRKLSEIHPNIRVLRYPDHIIRNSTLLWANHEKSVVIDQTYALLGGIDLCYGRWDDCAHRLSDLGVHSEVNECKHINSIKVSKSQQQVKQNSFLNDCFQSTDSYLKQSCPDYSVGQCDYMSIDLVRRSSSVQLRDPIISKTLAYNYSHPAVNGPTPVLQCCLSLESGLDLNKCSKHIHIVEMCLNSLPQWSNPMYHSIHRRLKERMLQIPRLLKNHCIEEQSSDVVDLVENVRKTLSSHNCRLWIGKDYSNVVVKDFCDVNHPFKELIDRTQQPRLPWHDVGMLIIGAVANDVSRHFIQRWNYTKLMKQKQCKKYPFILPENPLEKYNSAGMFNCDAQVLRSVGSWSSGQHRTERSIHNAYIKAISESKYYIYIENQFFISRTGSNSIVRNKIVDTIFQRIRKAILENTTYFVYIVMPLMPAFEGAYGSPAGVANETITHWNYRTISHGSESLIARLCALGCDPYKFISFCALRNWGNIKGQLVTEMVYVHSKMMIVDDRLVIIGSANINDRSLTGNRDSEIAVCIEDQEFVLAKLNGKTNDVGKFASSLRIRIMREHLGDLSDPPRYTYDAASTDFFQNVWQHTAAKNTMIYTKVFNCSPLDAATRFEDLRRLKSKRNLAQTNISLALDFLKQLNGYLVLVPLKFLQNENLLPSIWSKEALVPSYFWT